MAQYTRAVNTIDAGLWTGGVGRWKGEERDIDWLQFELVLLAFHFNTKRKFVLPLAEDEGEEAAIGGMLPLLRSCCCCCCALRKEIYVHYRLFLSDDVNFVAFLAFAACGMRQKKRDKERESRERHSAAPCSPCDCVLHVAHWLPLHRKEVKNFQLALPQLSHKCCFRLLLLLLLLLVLVHCMATFDLLRARLGNIVGCAYACVCAAIDCECCQHTKELKTALRVYL